MNALDAIVLLAIALAAWTGYRHGFTARALAWVGLIIGIVIGVLFVDDIADALKGSTSQTRLIGSLAFLFLMTVIGQTLGIAAGALLRDRIPHGGFLGAADRIAGALAGTFAVLIGVWLLTPALASAHGWPARAARGSAVVRAIDRVAPSPPASLKRLGRLVAEAPFNVFDRVQSPPNAGTPPGTGLSQRVLQRVSGSVVKIEGHACDLIQQGSGFVAADDLVVTNAHVVAGEPGTVVLTTDGRRLEADVVEFDSYRDLAVLHVTGLDLPVLSQADGSVDDTGAVIGYPGGGNEKESPARVADQILAKGNDIYGSAQTTRDVFVLAAQLAPGDSGGPLFDAQGQVIGIAFAVDPGDATTAYALTHAEIAHAFQHARASGARTRVSTGPCLAE